MVEAFESYITGLREGASLAALVQLRPGAALALRPGPGRGSHRLEVRTEAGAMLGWLPAEDSLALPPGAGWRAEVTALVPARLLPRVHIRVFPLA